ncbi:DNA polymerase III subunit delta [Loigolactobacillus backii]|uniref:DNA polymerase III subunit delta n=1 Tax=Loigolactobacillus backii TaxID=375175 RepID=A0A192H4G5_9LACO|nr:DNA polymerase III subunit delta [Loigolactobacillus backii]ANK59701.1 DNA polymerase III subunit delta [Loigolactobacillus backii]ANK63102.1 DNA polymerase III subunit delta [Loigolactobacillus backii]ANK64697.1 DNA polymerase III subunit delta [Loigolactobacillus backii]ANK66854.1 DNA polymerase III subunit delta [Loigolactobacillus backii]ANK69890.1 DNA polymerase III subunit delta [Loigolactobacillus backii]
MDVAALQKQLKHGEIAPVYLVQGQEAYLVAQVKKAFRQLLSEEELTMNFGAYDMTVTPLAVALNDAMSAPFFGERRVVFVENSIFLTAEAKKSKVEHDVASLLTYLGNPLDSTQLVIFAPYAKLDERKKVTKQLKRVAQQVDVKPLTQQRAQSYVTDYLKRQQLTMAPQAMALFLQRTEANLSIMMDELPKLRLYALEDHEISQKAVDQLVAQSLEQNVFLLVDAVMAQNVAQAVQLYSDLLLQKEEPLKINAILLGQFRLLLQIKILQKNGYSQGSLAQVLKVHPYRVKLAIGQARHFQQEALRAAYLGLVDMEYKMKSTQEKPELLFQLFVMQFVDKAIVS